MQERHVWTTVGIRAAMAVAAVTTVWLAAAPAHATEPRKPRGLVVLQPGILGFRELSILGRYWGDVPERLRSQGYIVVERAPAPVSSPSARGRELAEEIRGLTARYQVERVVVLAHSQGGVDLRMALMEEPWVAHLIGAVATIASPHHGSLMVDVGEALPAPVVTGILRTVHRAFETDQRLDARPAQPDEALASLSTHGMAAFAALEPAVPVPFFSIGGVTGDDVDGACGDGQWSTPLVRDVAAPTSWWNLAATQAVAGPHSTDGVVPTKSMRFGEWLGCVPADHGDWLGWVSHPLEEELVWSPTPFMVALVSALVDVDRHGAAAMDAHIEDLARLARAVPTT
jgi:triacylglycerol lipase